LNPFATEEETGRKRVWLDTDYDATFQDFEGARVEAARVDAKLVLGESFMYLSFPSLSRYRNPMMYHHFGVGMPSGFKLWGDLQLWGDTSDDIAQTEVVTSTLERRSNEGMLIVFPTGDHQILAADLSRLDGFVATWCRRLGWP